MPIYLTERDVAEFFDMPSAIDVVRAAFVARARGDAVIVPRRADASNRFDAS